MPSGLSQIIDFLLVLKAPPFYAAWYADYPDPDNFLYVLCHSKSKTNRMGYHNPEVDKLLEKTRQEIGLLWRFREGIVKASFSILNAFFSCSNLFPVLLFPSLHPAAGGDNPEQ
jgi:hypothetical protein